VQKKVLNKEKDTEYWDKVQQERSGKGGKFGGKKGKFGGKRRRR